MYVRQVVNAKVVMWYVEGVEMSCHLRSADARFEAFSRIRIYNAQRPGVVLLVLHGYTAAIGLLVGEQSRRIEPLIIDHRLASSPGSARMAAVERTDRVNTVCSVEEHRVSNTICAGRRGDVEMVVVVSLAHAWASAREQSGLAKDAHVALHVLLSSIVLVVSIVAVASPQEEGSQ